MQTAVHKTVSLFRSHGGMLRTSVALSHGVRPQTLYRLRDEGTLVEVARGLYRLAELAPLMNPDLAVVGMRIPSATLCLVSALAMHELTTQLPHEIQIALPAGTKAPLLDHPPIHVFRFTGKALTAGVIQREVDGVTVNVYDPEKTIVDCFKMRNKVGLDVALEGLKTYLQGKRVRRDLIWEYAGICRVQRVMRPYLEAMQ